LGEPYFIDGYQIRLMASMGAVVYPTDGQTDKELIRMADRALYRAKDRSGDASINALPMETQEEAETKDPATFQQPG
jgi:predicted signal transduction protein with EAL and GGDEF domain